MAYRPAASRKKPGSLSVFFQTMRNLTPGPLTSSRGISSMDQNLLVDQFSLWLTLASILIAVAVFLIAPFLMVSWLNRPFPGFVVEQTGVISDVNGIRWSGRGAGLSYPERVIAVDGQTVYDPAGLQRRLSGFEVGQLVQINTIDPGGTVRGYSLIVIRPFPERDLVRLFWLPYGIGLVFLLMGIWVFLIRGGTRPGRAFAFFCSAGAIATVLLFDLVTTHVFTAAWTIAIAMTGGSLFSLAMLFPEEWAPVQQRGWLRFLPYGFSVGLALWGLVEIFNFTRPWAYILAWRYSYIYLAAGILIFLGMMAVRLRSERAPAVRQQAGIILWGSLLSFAPLFVWIILPFFGIIIPWNTLLFLPMLLLLPLSIGFAILRYRLWDIDVILNRTLVYSSVTVLLGTIYIACILLLERLFRPFMGHNQMAAVISTLAIVTLFNPLRRRVQEFIDIRFYRRKYDTARTLMAFGARLRNEVNLARLTGSLEEAMRETMQPASVATWLSDEEGGFIPYGTGHPQGGGPAGGRILESDPLIAYLRMARGALEMERAELDSPAFERLAASGVKLALPMVSQGELVGWLSLGQRLSQRSYSIDDQTLLSNLADQAAPAVRVAQLVLRERARAAERERMEHELRLARQIQLSLLPKQLPSLDGWELAAHYQPARAVGGDFYDFIPLEGGRLGVVIGDVTGHGVPAALVMATTRSTLRAVAMDELSPGQALWKVNNQLEREIPENMFVTCLYAILNPASGGLRFANAGHNLPYYRTKTGAEELRARGMPLGLMPDMEYEEIETTLEPGVCLLLYSDGLVEAHNPERAMFGTHRLHDQVARAAGREAALIPSLLSELAEFTGMGWEQEDDITLVMLLRAAVRSI